MMRHYHYLVNQLQAWHDSTLGRELFKQEQLLLDKILPSLFGYHLLVLSLTRQQHQVDKNPIQHHIYIKRPSPDRSLMALAKAQSSDLPFASNSIDVVVMPHILEFSDNPERVLAEACRVVIPDGHIIIFGFNPKSLWGAGQRLRRRRDEAPWCGKFLRAKKIAHLLAGHDFIEVTKTNYFHKLPFLKNSGMLSEKFSRLLCPAGAYMIIAKKRVATITSIKTRWRKGRKLPKNQVVSPVNKV